jgi:hypothetical protein
LLIPNTIVGKLTLLCLSRLCNKCTNFFLSLLYTNLPRRDKNANIFRFLQSLERNEYDFGLRYLANSLVLNFGQKNICKRLTVARRMYSLSTGFPDCSKLSTTRVNGDTFSRCDSSFEISSKLCVRRCCIVVGAMLKSFYQSRLLLVNQFWTLVDAIGYVL